MMIVRRSSPPFGGPLLSVLLAIALLARLAAPAGWMPMSSPAGVGLMLCPGAASTPPHHAAMAEMHGVAEHDGPAEGGSEEPQPCAFSGMFAATTELPSTAASAPAPPPPVPLSGRRPEAAVGRGLAAPPPPSHAPPLILA